MAIIYAISVLFFVYVFGRAALDKEVRPYFTKRVLLGLAFFVFVPVVNTVLMCAAIYDIVNHWSEYKVRTKEIIREENIVTLQALDSCLERLFKK